MTTFDQLDIIHSYGQTVYFDNGTTKVMAVMRANTDNKNWTHPARGTGRDYDGAVDCLYTVLYHRMLDTVKGLPQS